ncbi:TauD/TfdA dioxygenase family protein [Limnohabitans sp.]|uniref:TauD/TfdA dioxygenase family protein n=1 Tax=Limnohabitans sp. TaxID=1907725 RepID=UPI0038BA94FE
MKIQRIAGALGAELLDVDLSEPISTDLQQAIRAALLEHLVIFFRDQNLSTAQFMRFAHSMGTPVEYPFVKGLDDFPCVIEVKKLAHEKNNFGGIWHSDTTYLEQPPMGSMLLAREIPPYGGDTLFANQYLAWETLSETLQSMLEGLMGISSSAKADVSKTREDRLKTDGKSDAPKNHTHAHPLVRTHPETGRKALYVNVAHTSGIVGMRDEESAPLLKFLFEHQVKAEFTCRFVWKPHSLAFWDNRCTQHNPVNDYHGFKRVMHRITLGGDTPV